MSIAEKLQTIAENEQRVYESGNKKGYSYGHSIGYEEGQNIGYDSGYATGYNFGCETGIEQGKQAEYDAFWDVFQKNGGAVNYNYAFAYGKFTDENYNPKYPIVCTNSTTGGQNMFRSSSITDTKQPITISTNGQGAFYECGIKTIRKLIVTEDTVFTNMFYATSTLENITIEGTIGKDFNSNSCGKLTHDSAMSIINALKDFSGTTTTRTLDLNVNTIALLSEEEKAIATNKGWTIA